MGCKAHGVAKSQTRLSNFHFHFTFLLTQTVKNLPAMQETWVRSLGLKDRSLEKGTAPQSSILAWRILWTEEPGGLLTTGSPGVTRDWATDTLTRALTLMGVWPAACHPKGLGLPTCEEGGKPRCGKASPALWLVSAQDQGADAGPGQQLPSVRSVYDSHSSPPRRGPWRPWAACPRSAGTPGGLLLPFLLCIWSEHLSRWQSVTPLSPRLPCPPPRWASLSLTRHAVMDSEGQGGASDLPGAERVGDGKPLKP